MKEMKEKLEGISRDGSEWLEGTERDNEMN